MHSAIYIVAATALIALLSSDLNSALEHLLIDGSTAMLRRSVQAVLATAALASSGYSQQVLDLGTIDWTLTSPNFSYISVPGKVPSQVHLDLRDAELFTLLLPGRLALLLDHPMYWTDLITKAAESI